MPVPPSSRWTQLYPCDLDSTHYLCAVERAREAEARALAAGRAMDGAWISLAVSSTVGGRGLGCPGRAVSGVVAATGGRGGWRGGWRSAGDSGMRDCLKIQPIHVLHFVARLAGAGAAADETPCGWVPLRVRGHPAAQCTS